MWYIWFLWFAYWINSQNDVICILPLQIVDYKNLMIKCLEDRHKISMLIYLWREGRSRKTDIYHSMTPNSNCPRKLSELEKMGLVTFDHRRFENNSTYVELTSLGLSIAKKLMDIENIMNGVATEGDRPDYCAPAEQGDKVGS